MLTLIGNEFRKLLSRKKTYVVFLGFAAFMSLMVYAKYRENKNIEYYNSPEVRLQQMQESINHFNDRMKEIDKELKKEDISEKVRTELNVEKRYYTEDIERVKNSMKPLEEAIKTGKKPDWRADLDEEIKSLENMISEDNNMPERYKLQQKEELNKLKYLRSNGIKPLKGYEFEGYNFLVNTMKEFIYIFIPLLVVVLVSDMVSGECTPPTLKFLITQPVKRGKVLFAKFITSLIASLFIIFIVQALAFLVVGMIGGFGNPDYPMSYGTKYLLDMTKLDELSRPTLVEIAGTRQMISMSTYVLRMFLLEGLFIFASCAFGFLVSVLFKSSMISMVFSSVTVFGMTILSILGAEFKSLAAVMKNIFFSYGSIPNLMEGKYALMYNDPSLTIERAIIVMAVWGIVSYIISHIYFTKRDILI